MGATLYYDGANLNAIMGICRPGDMGFDIVHFNLHKSFTQPHGGGGPGAGPVAVSDRLEPYLPIPQVVRRGSEGNGTEAGEIHYDLDYDRPKSIGRLRGFQGNYGVFVRAYAYIRSLGAAGLRDVSENAVLNANYLVARLRQEGVLEYLPVAHERLCMHEFVLSGGPMKRQLGIRTLDLAKRLLDFGVHPPTVYFPLIVDEALLIEPTETETRETLDGSPRWWRASCGRPPTILRSPGGPRSPRPCAGWMRPEQPGAQWFVSGWTELLWGQRGGNPFSQGCILGAALNPGSPDAENHQMAASARRSGIEAA